MNDEYEKQRIWRDYEIERLIELGEDRLRNDAANINIALKIIRKRQKKNLKEEQE